MSKEREIQELYPEALKKFRSEGKQLIYEFGLFRLIKDNGLSDYIQQVELEEIENSLKQKYKLKTANYGIFRPL